MSYYVNILYYTIIIFVFVYIYIQMNKMTKKCKKKVSPLKSLLHETNYVLGKLCLRSPKKKMHFCIEIQALITRNNKLFFKNQYYDIIKFDFISKKFVCLMNQIQNMILKYIIVIPNTWKM